MSNEYILQMKNVVKQYPGVLALDKVDLDLRKAEVFALIGENGAGKSTLMNILSGAINRDSGDILIDGNEIPLFTKPSEQMEAGIAIIYQELNYLEEMTIAENLFMGCVPVKGFLKQVDYKKMKRDSQELLASFDLSYHPFTLVKTLTIAEKQIIEIIRAVSKDIKVLIMDEPTSSLNDVETRQLFGFIESLKKKGVSVIYISHKLDEVFTIADRVQVMRDGKKVDVLDVKSTSHSELVKLMVGRTITDMYPKEGIKIGEEVLRVENMSCHITKDVSFSVKKGEILGLFGLVGSGRVEAVEGLLGINSIHAGKIFIEGEEIKIANPIEAKKKGIAYIPSDRKEEGLVLMHSVKDNLTVTRVDEIGKGFKIDSKKEKEYCETWINKLRIKTPSPFVSIESLSGGNQQKVVIAKWLLTNPKVLIMNDPTRGIDVGAKVEIYKVMEELCKEGISIIVVSSELPETVGITDRMVIFSDGQVVGEFDRSEYDQNKILHLAVGGESNDKKHSCEN